MNILIFVRHVHDHVTALVTNRGMLSRVKRRDELITSKRRSARRERLGRPVTLPVIHDRSLLSFRPTRPACRKKSALTKLLVSRLVHNAWTAKSSTLAPAVSVQSVTAARNEPALSAGKNARKSRSTAFELAAVFDPRGTNRGREPAADA